MNLAGRVLISRKTSQPLRFKLKRPAQPAIPVGTSDV